MATGPSASVRPRLGVVICSTRPGRVGVPVADWFIDAVARHGGFDVDRIDLAEVNLPALDEPKHPRLKTYEHDHTRAWSSRVDALDAVALVLPEYNFAMPPALLNALDYLSVEWNYKPVGIVSYGGVSAGTRSAQMAKLVLTTLKMMPLPEAVSIPFVAQFLQEGRIRPNDTMEESARLLLDELARWEAALRDLRRPAASM